MKKLSIILLALILTLSIICVVACTPEEEPAPSGSIRLRSEPEQNMQVGDIYRVVFDARYNGADASNEVNFVTSDTAVVSVDVYGNVTAVGAGTAIVTLSLKQDATIKTTMTCNVTKPFFMNRSGYINGSVDPTTADTEGWVHIKPGDQTQLLVSEYSENWYFSCRIEHTGNTGADSSGRWGVGSFLVDSGHTIGEVMAWFGFKPTNHATKTYTPYVGGWRVQSGGNDPEIDVSDAIANANIADMEIIRYGQYLYCTVTIGDTVAKYVYSCPSMVGNPTYPGVYSQRQELYVSQLQSSSDMSVVEQKLNNFQTAEEVRIEGVADTLVAGQTYNLVATILPTTTFDKSVIFSLQDAVSGVSITEEGVLTIASSVVGEITVVATAQSEQSVTTHKTYTVKAPEQSTHTIVDTTQIIATSEDNYQLDVNTITLVGGTVYLPLLTNSENWAVSFVTNLTAGRVGVLSATKGITNYVSMLIRADSVIYGAMTAEKDTIARLGAVQDNITVLRKGEYCYIIINDRLVERFNADLGQATMPVIYSEGAHGTLSNVNLVTELEDVNAIVQSYPFTVGRYVTVNGDGSYTLAPRNFTVGVNDINWPPVNNYVNGLKFANTITGNYTIEFNMSNIIPMRVGGAIDSKVLIYLRSESKTSSLQFCFKESGGGINVTFCPNLNDATWTEYPASQLNLLDGEVAVKVVKTETKVTLYINNVVVFEDNAGLNNLGYWDASTLCTPGIGTFNCGVTVSNVKLTID